MHNKTKKIFVTSFSSIGNVLLVLTMLGLIVSCGKNNSSEKSSQSIVRVNGDDITMLQLNNELQRANVPPDKLDEAGKQVASALVDRQILIQEAHKANLERKPRVIQAIENAKMQIIAQAYIQEKVSSLPMPTHLEITEYRDKHADIFANRKVFVMDELAFKVGAENTQDIQSLSDSAKSLEEVVQWLSVHQIQYARTRASHVAESVPLQLLDKLEKMAVGDMIFVNANGGMVAGRMIEVKNSAISEADSKPIIERIIFDQKRKLTIENEMKRLHSTAKIEYINKKFDPSAGIPLVKSLEPTTANQTKSEKAVASVNATSNAQVESHLQKGLAGLK